MTSGFKTGEYSIQRLCLCLENNHRNAFRAREGEKIDLGEDRETLEKLKSLSQYGDRVVVKNIQRNSQEWFEIYVDNIEVAHAYIDRTAWVGKSDWTVLKELYLVK